MLCDRVGNGIGITNGRVLARRSVKDTLSGNRVESTAAFATAVIEL
jgi:hypothetical protein